MTYEQATEARVTRKQAEAEVRRHGGTTKASRDAHWAAFLAECGDRATYSGSTILDWLGY